MDSDSDSERAVEPEKTKSRKPANTAFKQQRLKAWQPILTPKTVLPLFFCIAVIFAPIGGLLLYASNQVQELVIDYTHCGDATNSASDIPSKYLTQNFKGGALPGFNAQWQKIGTADGDNLNFTCRLEFEIPTDMGSPVYMYYRMTNFYQNHRRYVQSFNEDQLNGKAKSNSSLKSTDDCKPLTLNSEGKAYYPCGLIANSYFNDTFFSPILLNPTNTSQRNETYKMTDNGIAWSTDRNRLKKTEYNWSQVVPPPNWAKMFPHGYTEDQPPPDISEWESFQNWMRTAALPKFSKLALRNDHDTLKLGRYSVDIGYNFPVLEYDGTKSMVLTTRTVIGGRNPFLGIAYLAVGGICFVLGIVFLIKQLVHPRKLGDHSYLSWNNGNDALASGNDASSGAQRRM